MYPEKVILLLVLGSLASRVCLASKHLAVFSNACNRNTPEEEEVSSTPNSGHRSSHPELIDTKMNPLSVPRTLARNLNPIGLVSPPRFFI